MRRNYASLDLTALAASAEDTERGAVYDATHGAATDIAQLRLDEDEDPFASGTFFCSAGNVGFPMELLIAMNGSDATTKPSTPPQPIAEPRPTTPPSAMPMKKIGLPSIRPAMNEPVRRSFLPLSASPPDYMSMSKLSMSSSTAGSMRVVDCMASGPKPIISIQRNVIQSV